MPKFRNPALAATLACALASLTFAPARACGPDFPNAYLAEGSISLLSAPEGYFAAEIAKLAPPIQRDDARASASIAAANDAKRDGELTETGILRLELAKRGLPQQRTDALAAEFETVRANIFAKAWNKPPVFSEDMPAEFALYLRGAFSYWKNDFITAREYWRELLALPAAERQHYTVNAAYMIGRTYVPDDPRDRGTPVRYSRHDESMLESVRWFQQTREAAAAGFDDLSGLSQASLGWEARAWFFNGDDAKAIRLYLQQHACGDDKSAMLSLRAVASSALEHTAWDAQSAPDSETAGALEKLAQDEPSRRVLTLYVLARFGSSPWWSGSAEKRNERMARAWAATLEKCKLRDVPDTDRLAWLAYQAGYYELAETWLRSASADSVPANWIRAKLALRAGDSQGAETFLAKVTASPALLGEARPVAWADLGRVRMGRSKFTDALDAFMRGGHWEDSAYIAERVLTLDEVKSYVDSHEFSETGASRFLNQDSDGDNMDGHWEKNFDRMMFSLRHLLARRLARANCNDFAGKYFPEKFRPLFADYIASTRKGFDTALPAEERAHAFWTAAQLIREHGMELLGTELAPDYFIWDGSYEHSNIAGARQGELRLGSGPGAPTAEELKRLEDTPMPAKRYHYRYRAAELGGWAASLLPNDNDETARILATAGSWLKKRDAKAAKPFYQSLVIRCGNTALGKAAAAKNWFPAPVPSEKSAESDK